MIWKHTSAYLPWFSSFFFVFSPTRFSSFSKSHKSHTKKARWCFHNMFLKMFTEPTPGERNDPIWRIRRCLQVETHTLTLQKSNISPKNGILKMIFLFPRWDMLIPWRVSKPVKANYTPVGRFVGFEATRKTSTWSLEPEPNFLVTLVESAERFAGKNHVWVFPWKISHPDFVVVQKDLKK